ncbi:MAG: hypothetical protein KA383_18375 [Phycisphaerae bacterium]|nr:hypothetical protein [Phycisphaerae bacterium]
MSRIDTCGVRAAAWALVLAVGAVGALAQAPPATTEPATQPAGPTPIMARVLEVQGDVKHAPLDSEDFQPCQVDEEYPPETVIITGVRSSIKFQVGSDDTYTALVIEPVTRAIISEAYQTADTKRVRIGVGYGRMRAGVAEGGLKSDFTVDSPVATLSKRGTWDFGLFYERGTDRFEIFLLDQGLVDAFSKVTGERRQVLPRELVMQTMLRWAAQAQMQRNVPIADMLGQSDYAVAFNTLSSSGLGVVDPGGGQSTLINLSSTAAQAQFAELAQRSLPRTPLAREQRARPEGYFGTGRGDDLIPLIIEANSPLAQKGAARPGTYTFRRSALENWLAQHGRR